MFPKDIQTIIDWYVFQDKLHRVNKEYHSEFKPTKTHTLAWIKYIWTSQYNYRDISKKNINRVIYGKTNNKGVYYTSNPRTYFVPDNY